MTQLNHSLEAIFNPRNLDDDCDKIASLLQPYKLEIKEMLEKGAYHEAFTLFYEILESLSSHFVKDEHYCYFDDLYSPDYTCKEIMDSIIHKVKEGVVPGAELKYFKDAMDKISKMEAYECYGSPFAVADWVAFCKKYNLDSCVASKPSATP